MNFRKCGSDEAGADVDRQREDDPGWGEFLYQAFVIGCACATADVNTTTPAMRITCLAQGVVAFFFNTIILALTINIGASLF